MTFKEKLIELRGKRGLTQQQLAEVSGVPLSTLRKYEQDQRGKRVTLGVAIRLATAMGETCEVFSECADVREEEEVEKKKPAKRKPKK